MSAEVVPMNEARAVQPISAEAERFALRQRQARMFAFSPLVPDHLRKGTEEQALANCYIALTLAEAMGEVPLVVMQNIHVVNGKAGFATQYMIAKANAAGIFKGRIDWRIDRNDPNNLSVTAYAVLKDTGQEVSVTCDMAMAKAEGWTKNPKYSSMPDVMLRYRSAAFLVRFYAPDVMLGYQSTEEIEDVAISHGPDLTATPLSAAMLIEQSTLAAEVVVEAERAEIVQPEPDEEPQPGESEPAASAAAQAASEPSTATSSTEPGTSGENASAAQEPDEPAWLASVRGIRGSIEAAKNVRAIGAIENDWLNRIRITVTDDKVVASVEGDIAAKKRELKAVEG